MSQILVNQGLEKIKNNTLTEEENQLITEAVSENMDWSHQIIDW